MSRGTTKDDATFRSRFSPLVAEFPSLFGIILLRFYGSLTCDAMSPARSMHHSRKRHNTYLLRAIDAHTIELRSRGHRSGNCHWGVSSGGGGPCCVRSFTRSSSDKKKKIRHQRTLIRFDPGQWRARVSFCSSSSTANDRCALCDKCQFSRAVGLRIEISSSFSFRVRTRDQDRGDTYGSTPSPLSVRRAIGHCACDTSSSSHFGELGIANVCRSFTPRVRESDREFHQASERASERLTCGD